MFITLSTYISTCMFLYLHTYLCPYVATSVSGNESEPALLSESGLEEGDAQAIASFNSSLTRSILMLDIWLSQVININTRSIFINIHLVLIWTLLVDVIV